MMEYKCPCCGGAVEFDSTIQKLKCPYCDTEFDIDALNTFDEEAGQEKNENMDWNASEKNTWSDEEAGNMDVYICQSCGGEIVVDKVDGATTCPYCGNNVVMKEQFSGDLRPDYVIPFKVSKKEAKAKLKAHFQGKKLLPKCFSEENHLEEIKGVYVPFWLFDGVASGEVHYKGTKIRTWSDANYIYTETSFYDVVRGGEVGFAQVPVDGSSKTPDELMQSLEPFDFSEAVSFEAAYLAGYLAERYDVSAEDSMHIANARIKQSTMDVLDRAIKGSYANLAPVSKFVNLKEGQHKYALYPVWILNTIWNGKSYTFAMNGQTGKFVGDLPIDKAECKKQRIKWTAIISAVLYVFALIFLVL